MSRSRKSNPETALMNALALFWAGGFEGTGTRQIEDRTGITRFTLQRAYGGKKALFLQALDRYLDMFEAIMPPPGPGASLDDLADWFEALLAPPLSEGAVYGCLLLNTVAEFGAADEDVNLRAQRYFALIRTRFIDALTGIAAQGGLGAGPAPEEGAEILVACAIAMNAHTRAAGTADAARPLARATATMLRGWAG